MVMSSNLLEASLQTGSLDMLAFLISHELSHLSKGHLLSNLSRMIRFGDLRR